MRFLHTADWHLGRLFHGYHLTEDQAHVLDQFVAIAKETKPDAILIAGDLYDRAIPPPDAVALLDDILSRLVLDLKIPTFAIAGNHDSAARVEFGSRLMERAGLRMVGQFRAAQAPLLIRDEHGEIEVHLLPFIEPATVRAVLGMEESLDHSGAMHAALSQLPRKDSRRAILVAHTSVTGGIESESERPITIGNVGGVSASEFSSFNYVALGHLHAPQNCGGSCVHYSGSILKYSLSEIDHRKGVKLVEMDATGHCCTELIPLSPRRDLRRIEGRIADLVAQAPRDSSREDYIHATMLDEGLVLDAIGRLRQVYPNIVEIRRPEFSPAGLSTAKLAERLRNDDRELFASFFSQVTGQELSDAQRDELSRMIQRLDDEERETIKGGAR